MKLLLLSFAAAALILAAGPTTHAQEETAPEAMEQDQAAPLHAYSKTIPFHGLDQGARKAFNSQSAVAANSSGIPTWNYTVTSPLDGNTYSGSMVGASPFFNGARTISIPTVVIPLVIKMPDGFTFDPTASDKCSTWGTPISQVLGSPIFEPASYTMNGINMGTGQYVDEFQRANFYNANVSTTSDSYHNVLSPVTTLSAFTISIPVNEGQTGFFGSCAPTGVMDFGTFDTMVTALLQTLTSQGVVSPASFVVFVIHDVVMADPGDSVSSNCCTISYHSAFATSAGVQTYAVADFDTSRAFQNPDIQPLSNVVGGWMDDPFGTNLTPSWGRIGQVVQCQNTLEVGEPLNGIPPTVYQVPGTIGVTMPSGQTFFPQALAYFSWFYRQNPSVGAANQYSNFGWTGYQKTLCD